MNDFAVENAISVTEVNLSIKACLDTPIFKNLDVYGEVSGFKIAAGNAYFTLKDKNGAIACNCWGVQKTYVPKDGESVIVHGYVDYWTKGGRLTFVATRITAVGQGLLFIEFEKLKAKLLSEGIFAPEHKVKIPEYPKNVLVITSKTGAVIRDIVTTVRRKNPIVNLVVKDVRVQGEYAAKEIVTALKRADNLGFDVIVIARGGGSLEDLAPFYDEGLVRAVYDMKTPVISAVGHETDFSLCDFVADMRAPTPTAAGELIAYDWYAMVDDVKDNMARLNTLAQNAFARKLNRVQLAGAKIQHSASEFCSARLHRVQMLDTRMLASVQALAQSSEGRLARACSALDTLSPLKTLKRGYFKVESSGKSVVSVKKLAVGDTVGVTGSDGTFDAEIKKISISEEK